MTQRTFDIAPFYQDNKNFDRYSMDIFPHKFIDTLATFNLVLASIFDKIIV